MGTLPKGDITRGQTPNKISIAEGKTGGADELGLCKAAGPQPFWHQGLVSWETIFPGRGVGGVGGWQEAELR